MIQYITALSKYLITIFMILYTMESYIVFKLKSDKSRKFSYVRQTILMVLMHFSCFLNLCLKSEEIYYLYYFIAFEVFILMIIEIVPMIYPKINRLLISNMAMLLSVGLIMLARLDFDKAVKQLIIAIISFVISSFIPLIMVKIKKIPCVPYFYGIFGCVLLLAVYLAANVINGSKLAVTIFGISFQASEFVKILFVLFVAGALYNSHKFIDVVLVTALAAIHVCLLAASRDFGAALIYFVVYLILIFIATRNYIYLFLGTAAGCMAAYIAFKLFRHIQVRVQAFIDPFSVIDNEGYQITQSLFAIGSGNWFGLGLFDGTPETIPYVETDFIFSAIAEEMGLIFSICLLLIILSCFLMFINIGIRFKNRYYRYIAIGLGITYIFQVFLTVGGGTKFIPLTGVTLPFISYGGSSIFATTITFFIIEGMYLLKTEGIMDDVNSENEVATHKYQSKIILVVSYIFVALFVALSIYISFYIKTNEIELINNSYNPRQEVLIAQNTRGTIYSRDMGILATTIERNGEEERYYPYANIFAHVVGYSINGRAGIEGQANFYLINSNQPLQEKVAADINNIKYIGDSVVTTLDEGLQKMAYTAIGSYDGAVVVSNPKTGEILAMVSKPDFDPNEIEDIWDDLINDKESSVLLNRSTQGLYPPGSTFKIVTLLEYLKEHPENFSKYSFDCSGKLTLPNNDFVTCYNCTSHGHVNLKQSLAFSCNSSFGKIGLLLDRDKYQKTLDTLLFNSELPLSMNYSKSICQVSDDLDDLTMVRTAFGQGDTLMTPMHLNLITQAIANNGVLMKPYLVSSVINSNEIAVKTFKPDEYKRLLSEEESALMKEMMSAVVTTYGATGSRLRNKNYTVAGKTGSAEYSDFSTSTHSWFTGFAPVEDPEICVTIILEDAGTSGLHAVPMAKKIFDEYFKRSMEINLSEDEDWEYFE